MMEKNTTNQETPDPGTDYGNICFAGTGETLESISWGLKIQNPAYLRQYHNARCSPFDIIPEEGTLRFLQKIYIPCPEEVAEMNGKIQQQGESLCYLLPYGKIPFNITSVSGDYEVRQTENEDGIQKLEYTYTVHLSYIKEEENNHYLYFSMSDLKKDGEEPEQKINSLATDFMKIIYPIQLRIDGHGSFVAAEAHTEIKEILCQIEELKKYHGGPYAALHIEQMKSKMADSRVMYDSLKDLIVLQFFFGRFYQAEYHSKDMTSAYHDEFSWLAPASPMKLEMVHRTLPQEDTCFIEMVQTGRATDYRTLQELYHTDKEYDHLAQPHARSLKGNHKATYTLAFPDFSVRKISAEFEMEVADYRKKMTFELVRRTEQFGEYQS
ncbi:hypothetical protein [Chryseobacterium pennipullorum]|uniref:Uncharacterized protein n=1 Tax=Chryseobacterium pennipullorum TaxID=2258963 RepID=A0A3D9B916_9FLAO|nr:hypothetical protein [Chryseobacterium pennipullorum]REC50184.1 hypothetical protein DRF67_01215 [Chryseobacterium pennipullorum]